MVTYVEFILAVGLFAAGFLGIVALVDEAMEEAERDERLEELWADDEPGSEAA